MTAPKRPVRHLLFSLTALPVFIILIALCVMNADMVSVMWSPVSPLLELPLFVIMLSFFTVGFLMGSLLTWLDKQ